MNSNCSPAILNSRVSDLKFEMLQYYKLNLESLQKVYEGDPGYLKDAILFIHKDGMYIHGFNENVLQWNDEKISSYYVQAR